MKKYYRALTVFIIAVTTGFLLTLIFNVDLGIYSIIFAGIGAVAGNYLSRRNRGQ
jgi:hypothetical protein